MSCFQSLLTLLSSLGTIGAFVVSYRIYKLQQSVEDAKKPDVKIWYKSDGNASSLTFVNFGEKPLPIKRIDVPNEVGTVQYNLLLDGEQISDWLIKPNQVYTVAVLPTGGTVSNFKLRVQFFNGKFIFLDVDTSFLGPYWISQHSSGKDR